ncbi:hypothetical protein A6E29_01705 [Chlamydia trachomatis]|nr:hypothetical protein A6E29_01705 [Chlamydia trachomatis]
MSQNVFLKTEAKLLIRKNGEFYCEVLSLRRTSLRYWVFACKQIKKIFVIPTKTQERMSKDTFPSVF